MLCVGTISGGLPDVFFRFTDLKVMLNQSDPIQEYPCCEAHKRLDDFEQVHIQNSGVSHLKNDI